MDYLKCATIKSATLKTSVRCATRSRIWRVTLMEVPREEGEMLIQLNNCVYWLVKY